MGGARRGGVRKCVCVCVCVSECELECARCAPLEWVAGLNRVTARDLKKGARCDVAWCVTGAPPGSGAPVLITMQAVVFRNASAGFLFEMQVAFTLSPSSSLHSRFLSPLSLCLGPNLPPPAPPLLAMYC